MYSLINQGITKGVVSASRTNATAAYGFVYRVELNLKICFSETDGWRKEHNRMVEGGIVAFFKS